MDWSSIWHGIVSNAIYGFVILGGGLVLALLKKKGSAWFAPALYGLIGCGLVAVVVIAFVVLTRIPKPPPDITSENVEANIRTWLDSFGWSTKRVDDPLATFALVATLDNGTPIEIARPKAADHYISLASALVFTPEQKEQLDKISKAEANQLADDVKIEMTRMKTGYEMRQPESITLSRQILISNNLTEGVFLQNIEEMDSAIALAKITMVRSLQAHTKAKP